MPVELDYEEYDLGRLTWPTAEAAIPDADFLLLPTGSIEQHSHHLPVSVDTLRAESLTRILAEKASERDMSILRLPTLPYGYSEHHANFPGTITLDNETYQSVLVEIGESLARHGCQRFIIANYHGGNEQPIKLAADRIQRDHDLRTYPLNWTDYGREELTEEFGEEWGHAGEHETSVIELFYPGFVDADAKVPQTRRGRFDVRQYTYFEDITAEGGIGDPTQSDPAFVEGVVERTTARILDALEADIEEETELGDVDPV